MSSTGAKENIIVFVFQGGGSWDGVPKEEAQQRLGRLLLSKIRPLGKVCEPCEWPCISLPGMGLSDRLYV